MTFKDPDWRFSARLGTSPGKFGSHGHHKNLLVSGHDKLRISTVAFAKL